MTTRVCGIVVACLFGLSPRGGAQSTAGNGSDVTIDLRVRDSLTGLGVPGIEVSAAEAGSSPSARQVAPEGTSARVRLAAADREVVVRAPGYRPLSVRPPQVEAMKRAASGAPGAVTRTTVWLDPERVPPDMSENVIAARRQAGAAFLHGHVVDAESLRPVPQASVRLKGLGSQTRTNREGYFWLNAPTSPPRDAEGGLPPTDDLLVEALGYKVYRLANVPLLETDTHFVIDLEAGSGETSRDEGHKLLRPLEDAPAPLPRSGAPGGEMEPATRRDASEKPCVLQPVEAVDVEGYGLMSLETYVANGLNDEWFASWHGDALRAGAVAYRSYGAWHQINRGVICRTTSCQVYDGDSSTATRLAARHTAGILLEAGGRVALAEYSAENNARLCSSHSCVNWDLSCRSGSAGSPSAGWPCLEDAHPFGSGPGECCFGHGRGMCQWGTQAWGNAGRGWVWIVNHYYNDSGAGSGHRAMFMTSPVSIASASASPSELPAGSSFTVDLTGRNLAELQHGVLIGTRLAGAPGDVPNPGSSQAATLAASEDTSVRVPFSVPPDTPPGPYELLVELWLDADGNGRIGPVDMCLATTRISLAVTVREGAPPAGHRVLRLTHPYQKGDDVQAVQTALRGRGFGIEVDGIYGPVTERTVRSFQEQAGLVADGKVGPLTRAALAAARPSATGTSR